MKKGWFVPICIFLILMNFSFSGCITSQEEASSDDFWLFYKSQYRYHISIDKIENKINHTNITNINRFTSDENLVGKIQEDGLMFDFSFIYDKKEYIFDCMVKNNLHIDEGDDLAFIININYVTRNENIIDNIKPFFYEIGNYIEDIIEIETSLKPYNTKFEIIDQ